MTNRKKTGTATPQRKRSLAIIALTVGYLLGVILGCFVIWAVPFFKNKSGLLEFSYTKGIEDLYGSPDEPAMIFGMEHWVFSADGTLISREASFLSGDQQEHVHSYLPVILKKGQVFRPTFFRLAGQRHTAVIFGILAGMTVEGPDGDLYVSIMLRDLPDLSSTMLTYVAAFTILYIFGVLLSLTTIRKDRELNRMRQDLIANVSHELKTPITAIRAMAETLHDGIIKDEETRHSYSKKIIEESDALEQLVLDILELSRLQSKRTQFVKSAVYTGELFRPVVDRYMMLCGDLNITLDTSGLDLTTVPVVYTDAEKIVNLVTVLMDNAVKFAGKGGTIRLSNQVSFTALTFCISDNGPGIPPEDISRVFDRFYKSDLAHNSSGSGLGLSIAGEIARGLNEKLWVESTYGSGASFYFTISC